MTDQPSDSNYESPAAITLTDIVGSRPDVASSASGQVHRHMVEVEPRPLIRNDIPQSARIWNFWMGGKDYCDIDRIVGDECISVYPDITTMAVQSRQFLVRAVEFLARDAGVHQFLDIGCGLPAVLNTHEIAQAVAPASRVAYVDTDPLVLAYARALLTSTTPEGMTTCVDADFHEPKQILYEARNLLDFTEPIAVMFMGVLGHARSHDDLLRTVRTVMAEVPSGSCLALWDGTDDSPAYVEMCRRYGTAGAVPYVPRPREAIRAAFDGLTIVEPGFVPITHWRAVDSEVGQTTPVSAYGAVARKHDDEE